MSVFKSCKRSGVINFSSEYHLCCHLVRKAKHGDKEETSLQRKARLNSQQGDSLVISYMMLSSFKKVVDPDLCYTNPSDRQRSLGFRVNLPWASDIETPHTRCTKSNPQSLPAAQVLTAAGTCGVSLTFQISLQDIVSCGLWCLRKRKPFPESLQVITVTVASIFSRAGRNAEGACSHNPSEPENLQELLQECKSSQTHHSLFISVLTESIYNHPRLLLLCLSAKAGAAWGQHSSNLTEK